MKQATEKRNKIEDAIDLLNIRVQRHSGKTMETLTPKDYFEYEKTLKKQSHSPEEKVVISSMLEKFSNDPSTNAKQKQESQELISNLQKSLPETFKQDDYQSLISEIFSEQKTPRRTEHPLANPKNKAAEMIASFNSSPRLSLNAIPRKARQLESFKRTL